MSHSISAHETWIFSVLENMYSQIKTKMSVCNLQLFCVMQAGAESASNISSCPESSLFHGPRRLVVRSLTQMNQVKVTRGGGGE